jgi:hypothetical protein
MNKLLGRLQSSLALRSTRWGAKTLRAEQQDGGIGAEAPIRKASQDRLRRTDFAHRIAGVLSELSLREGRVFAIRGGWGFGKSSLKNLIIERLDAMNGGADWLDFNPWQWGDGDMIARALFGQIADRLGGEHSTAARARASALRRYGEILTGSAAPLKEAGSSNYLISMVLTNASVIAIASAIGLTLPAVAGVAAALVASSVGIPLVGRLMSFFGRDHANEPLDQVREALSVRLRELDRPLVVFVDDIDRLEPEQIRMVLRQVKANANLPNIVFLLLFQPSIVERALNPVADGDGRAFLEKIVQASFDLPIVPENIVYQTFAEELSELVRPHATEVNGFTQARWGNVYIGCIQPMLRNIRDVRRLISSIAIHLPLHTAGDVFEVNIIDFLLLETLRVFEPDLHEALFRERGLVLQEGRFSNSGRREEDRAAAERLLATASEKQRTIARDALKNLFPTLEWAYGGTNYTEGFHSKWLSAKRVCTQRYFPRYFELQTAIGEISEHRFIAFLEATTTEDELTAAIFNVEADGLLPSLVVRFDESVDRLPVENAGVLLPVMFAIAQKFADAGPFNLPWISAWRATSWFLKRIPRDGRSALVLNAFRKTEALAVAATLIYLNDPADRKDDPDQAFEPVLDLETVEAMKVQWLQILRSRAADGTALIAEPDLLSLLYRWKTFTGSLDEPRRWVEKAIQTDEGFARMAALMMSRGSIHSFGDRVSVPHNTYNKETIDDFIGIDVAKARCSAIDPAEFPEHEEALRTLRSFLEAWLGLRKSDPFDL